MWRTEELLLRLNIIMMFNLKNAQYIVLIAAKICLYLLFLILRWQLFKRLFIRGSFIAFPDIEPQREADNSIDHK